MKLSESGQEMTKERNRRCVSKETRQKMREAKQGKHLSEEHKKNISKSCIGKVRSEDTKKKIGDAKLGKKNPNFGKHLSVEIREKIGSAHRGKIISEETKRKMSESKRGEKCYAWKGGITPLVMQIRKSLKYHQWVLDVLVRDDYTCQICGKRGGELHAHHVKSFSQIFHENGIRTLEQALECEEFWIFDNGRTLCESCHLKEHERH